MTVVIDMGPFLRKRNGKHDLKITNDDEDYAKGILTLRCTKCKSYVTMKRELWYVTLVEGSDHFTKVDLDGWMFCTKS